jgi:hypothetical protein
MVDSSNKILTISPQSLKITATFIPDFCRIIEKIVGVTAVVAGNVQP